MLKFLSLVLVFSSLSAFAENLPAQQCQIYIRKVTARPSSHGSASMRVVVKVGWLGNGENIRRVGFYGYSDNQDLGNSKDCHYGTSAGRGPFRIVDPAPTQWEHTELGEYAFYFNIRSGSVTGQCPGWRYSSIGTFFVETDRNTYWVNPNMDSAQYFYFDNTGYESVSAKGGTYQDLFTDREDLRYYNPLSCR